MSSTELLLSLNMLKMLDLPGSLEGKKANVCSVGSETGCAAERDIIDMTFR